MNLEKFEEILKSVLVATESLCGSSNKTIAREARHLHEEVVEYCDGLKTLIANDSMLTIGVVGRMKAGKSTFLNSLIFGGEPVLPKAATPMTAGLTVIEYTDGDNSIEAEYFTEEEWGDIKEKAERVKKIEEEIISENPAAEHNEILRKSLLKSRTDEVERAAAEMFDLLTPQGRAKIGKDKEIVTFEDISEIKNHLNNYVGSKGEFTSVVKSLYIKLNDDRLKGMRIVDTPGVNDPVLSREMRTHAFLKSAHGVLMLTMVEKFMSQSDIDFLNKRITSEGINCVLILASRMDESMRALQYKGQPFDEIYETLCKRMDSEHAKKKSLLAKPDAVKGMELTAGIAFSIAKKLKEADGDERAACLDGEESHALKKLRDFYPEDFEDSDDIVTNLEKLANFSRIRDKYIYGEFSKRKQELIESKILAYQKGHIDLLRSQAEEFVQAVEAEISFIDNVDLKKLVEIVRNIDTAIDMAAAPMELAINEFLSTLQSLLAGIQEEDLDRFKPRFSSVITEPISIIYTRVGTSMGFKHESSFTVNLPNQESITVSVQDAMREYSYQLRKLWKEAFTAKRKVLTEELLQKLKETSVDFGVNDSTIRLLLNETLTVRLEGKDTLRLRDLVDQECQVMDNFVRSNEHVNISTTVGKLSPSDAETELINRASELCSKLRKGITEKLESYVTKVDHVADQQVDVIIGLMAELKGKIKEDLSDQMKKIVEKSKEELKDKKVLLATLNEALATAKSICADLAHLDVVGA